jgi:hypothetical protein
MLRRMFLVAALALLSGPAAWAEDYSDKVKAVDPDKHTLTIPVDGKDKTFKVIDKPEVLATSQVGKKLRQTPVKEGLKGVKAGADVTVKTERRDGEEVVTKIVLLLPEKK